MAISSDALRQVFKGTHGLLSELVDLNRELTEGVTKMTGDPK